MITLPDCGKISRSPVELVLKSVYRCWLIPKTNSEFVNLNCGFSESLISTILSAVVLLIARGPPMFAAFATLSEVSVPKLVTFGCAAVLSVPPRFVEFTVVASRVGVTMLSLLIVVLPFVIVVDVMFVKYPAVEETETDDDT